MKRRLAAWSACLAAASGPAIAAEPLGRLFFTPEQRALLDLQRRSGGADGLAAAMAESLRLDGMLTRSDGRTAIWVNGRQLHDERGGGLRAAATHGRVRTSAATGGPAEIRVGETLDPATGARSDLVAPGAVRAGDKRSP